ncbi:MAG: hypothetical protein ACPGWR_23575, partial [Ardenticatenaceae bacterium]
FLVSLGMTQLSSEVGNKVSLWEQIPEEPEKNADSNEFCRTQACGVEDLEFILNAVKELLRRKK